MAKYEIVHACGCKETVNICGKVENRQGEADRLASRICSDCFQAQREKENAESAEQNREKGLPPLTGSAKQISWAETIRAKLIKDLDELLQSLDRSRQGEELYKVLIDSVDEVRNQTGAGYWIDNRDRDVRTLIMQTDATRAYKEKTNED